MRPTRAIVAAFAAAALLVPASGCSRSTRSVAPVSPVATVSGEVTDIRDLRPSDGGVDFTIRPDDGPGQNVYLESLYTAEPKPQWLLELHQQVTDLAVGDGVRVTGVRTERGLRLQSLTRLGIR